ncbi:MAG: RNase adapter RapZ [Rhodospirillaceae bacterium]|nr:RNase adapter RapZ [Rhodospirillaceae bacterium]
MMPTPSHDVVVTGLSGAGKSTTLKTFEDLGYEAVDNVPLFLLRHMIREDTPPRPDTPRRPLAIGVDIRTRDFDVDAIRSLVRDMEKIGGSRPHIVFLDCDDIVLQRRYTETRRRHPLAADRPLTDGIALERQILAPLRDCANDIIDTSDLPPGTLKTMLFSRYGLVSAGLHVFVTSFSFRRGLPREADLVFDVRFLRNPHYDPQLRDLTGRDTAVQAYITADPDFPEFMTRLVALLDPLLPRYVTEGKSYLTLAVGCTGGRHRSVFVAERLGTWLMTAGYSTSVRHRELQPPDS